MDATATAAGDDELRRRVTEGDEAAFAELVRRRAPVRGSRTELADETAVVAFVRRAFDAQEIAA